MEVPPKVKNRTANEPPIPLLGTYPKELKSRSQRDCCTPIFIATLFAIAKVEKQPKFPSTDKWMKKLWYIHTMEYYSALKEKTKS